MNIERLDALVREGTCATCKHASYQHRLTYRDIAGALRGWSCVMFNCRCEQFITGESPNMIPKDVVTRSVILSLPVDIDPAALKPGQTVVGFFDDMRQPLIVLRVEPLLVCRAPDGSEVTVYAHEVYVPET